MIAAGGTAGHVVPALAVADALRERDVLVTFAGSQRAEAQLVPEAGYELDTFRAEGLPRRPSRALASFFVTAARAPAACLRILVRRRPHVVFGAGGYVAGPMALAAAARRIPLALAEADAHFGLANRMAAPFATRIFLAFPIAGREGGKYRVIGRPIRHVARVERLEARRLFDLPADGRVLLVFGGSQGARVLNDFAVTSFGEAGPPVLHLCGERYYEELRVRVARPDYRLLPFTREFASAVAAADLALARAGGSVWELAAAGLPAVLVPSPNVTADHQTKNARFFEAAGGAVVVPESQLGARGAAAAVSLLGDAERLRTMREAMLRTARPEAAAEIAEELIALALRG